jgi:hypothetical protein
MIAIGPNPARKSIVLGLGDDGLVRGGTDKSAAAPNMRDHTPKINAPVS